MRELTELLGTAGHDGFRDARGPMGFSQRQAGGKFTCGEAQAFIDQLENAAANGGEPASPPQRALRAASDEQLLDEVRRRGLTMPLP